MSSGVDYPLGETIDFLFTTRDFDTGAPQTLGGTPAVSVYENGSLTQITAGVSLTADFDSTTGLNHVSVVATSGNGYESGKSYHLVITTGTVDTVSVVGEVVGHFTIERSAAFNQFDANGRVDVGSWLGTAVTTSATSAKPEVDAASISDSATAANNVEANISNLDAAITTRSSHTAANAADAVWDEARADHVAAGSFGEGVKAESLNTQAKADVNAEADTALTDYDAVVPADLPTNFADLSISVTTGRVDVASIEGSDATDQINAALDAALDTAVPVSPTADSINQRVKSLDDLLQSGGSGDAAAILTDTNSLNDTKVPQTLNLTALGNIGIDWANVENPTTALDLSGTDIQLADTATDVTNRVSANTDQIAGDATAATNLKRSASGIVPSAVNDATATTTSFVTDLTETTDDHYNGRIIVFTSGNLAGQGTDITDYTGSSKTVTVTALTEAPADNDQFVIV